MLLLVLLVPGVGVQAHQQLLGEEVRIRDIFEAREQQQRSVTILLHKPVGYVSGQAEDGHQPAVMLISAQTQVPGDKLRFQMSHLKGLAPAGRLDIDSTGLLVLTQDGRIAKRLIGDETRVEKEYLALVRGRTFRGHRLFGDNCAACHGMMATGNPGFPDLTDREWLWGGSPDAIARASAGADAPVAGKRARMVQRGVKVSSTYSVHVCIPLIVRQRYGSGALPPTSHEPPPAPHSFTQIELTPCGTTNA